MPVSTLQRQKRCNLWPTLNSDHPFLSMIITINHYTRCKLIQDDWKDNEPKVYTVDMNSLVTDTYL